MDGDGPVAPAGSVLEDGLEKSRNTLMEAIAGLDEEGFRARHEPSEWTAAEVLAHLLGMEGLLMKWAQAALENDRPVIAPLTDSERREQAKQAQRSAVPQILHGLLAGRRDTRRLLRGMSSEELARPLEYAQEGEQTVAWLFRWAAGHEEEHAAQIRVLRSAPAVLAP